MAKEYYIAASEGEDPRGPYDLEKLKELVAEGTVTAETLYFWEEKDLWRAMGENQLLVDNLFTEKKKLTLVSQAKKKRSKAPFKTPSPFKKSEEGEEKTGVDINEIIDAAEGRTKDTEEQRKKQESEAKAAGMTMYLLAFALWILAFSLIAPRWELLAKAYEEEHYSIFLQEPWLLVGLLDVLWGILLFLGTTQLFHLARFRLLAGMGYWGYWHYSYGDTTSMYAILLGSMLVFVATVTRKALVAIVLSLLGFVCLAGYVLVALMGVPEFWSNLFPEG